MLDNDFCDCGEVQADKHLPACSLISVNLKQRDCAKIATERSLTWLEHWSCIFYNLLCRFDTLITTKCGVSNFSVNCKTNV